MPFKKIVRHVPAKEPEYIPDPNQISILDQIAEIKQLTDIDAGQSNDNQIKQDGSVKWSGKPVVYDDNRPTLGMILALQPFNPFKDNQPFALMLYQYQKPGDKGWKRVFLLNQDLSPKTHPNGSHPVEFWHNSSVVFIGYAKG